MIQWSNFAVGSRTRDDRVRAGTASRNVNDRLSASNLIEKYLKDAPLKLAVPTAIGAALASIGGLVGLPGQRPKLRPERPS